MTIRHLQTLAAAIAVTGLAQAQEAEARYNHSVGVRADVGKIMQTNKFLRSRDMKHYQGGQIEFAWQTLGTREWEHAHRLPSFGIGIGTAWLDNSQEVGHPTSVYGFYNGVIARLGRGHSFHYNIEAGLACGWTPYHEVRHPENIAVGSKVTCRIGLGLQYAYTIANQWKIGVGAGFTHYSNGAVRKPNKGINLGSVQVSAAYLLKRKPLPQVQKPLKKLKGNEIDVTLGYGFKRFEVDTIKYPDAGGAYKLGARYNSFTLQGQFLHQYCHKGKYGIGLSMVYDELPGSTIRVEGDDVAVVLGPASKRYSFGVFGAHEFCIGNLGIVTQMGYYLHQPSGITKKQRKDVSFQRAGLKYTFPIGIHTGVNIYAHRLTVADFIEWNVGYSFKLGKKTTKV